MANNTYVIDNLATGTATVFVTDDGTGIDWLDFNGVYAEPTDIRLVWTVVSGQPTSAMGFYFSSGNIGHRLVVNGVIENVRGSNGNDLISGNIRSNILFGDQASTGSGLGDTIDGDLGNDTIYGGSGADSIGGDEGRDMIYGDAGADTISGGAGRDTIRGGTGADSMSGGGSVGDSVSYSTSTAGVRVQITFGSTTTGAGGHAAGDRINGFSDIMGSAFSDVLTDTVSGTVAFGGNDNRFSGGAGADTLRLNGGDDIGVGGAGRDVIYGGVGNDILFGGTEADQLFGGLGADRLTGDSGADRFVFASAQDSTTVATSRDTITDFSRAEGDKINLSTVDAIAGGGIDDFVFIGAAAFSALGQLRLRVSGSDIVVEGNIAGGLTPEFAILVQGVSGLIGADFLL